MPDYVTLMGAEQVQRAAGSMQDAADTMRQAAGSISEALREHRIWADGWISQLGDLVERVERLTERAKTEGQ